MALQYSVAVRNAKLDAVETTVGTSAVMEIRTGSMPANVAASRTGTVLATLSLPSDWMAAASSGSKAKSGTWQDTSADAAGTAGYFTIYASDGTTPHIQGTATATLALAATASITEGSDSLSAAGALPIIGTATPSEASDTVSAAAVLPIAGAASITEAGDALAGAGAVALVGSASVSEAGDTLQGLGTLSITGTASLTEAGDTLQSEGGPSVFGSADIVEADDTLTATTTLSLTAAAAITEDGDNLSATATVTGSNVRVRGGGLGMVLPQRRIEELRRAIELEQEARQRSYQEKARDREILRQSLEAAWQASQGDRAATEAFVEAVAPIVDTARPKVDWAPLLKRTEALVSLVDKLETHARDVAARQQREAERASVAQEAAKRAAEVARQEDEAITWLLLAA